MYLYLEHENHTYSISTKARRSNIEYTHVLSWVLSFDSNFFRCDINGHKSSYDISKFFCSTSQLEFSHPGQAIFYRIRMKLF